MNFNHRQQQRSSLKKHSPRARFHVKIYNWQYILLGEVHDVSVTGAGIKIPSAIWNKSQFTTYGAIRESRLRIIITVKKRHDFIAALDRIVKSQRDQIAAIGLIE